MKSAQHFLLDTFPPTVFDGWMMGGFKLSKFLAFLNFHEILTLFFSFLKKLQINRRHNFRRILRRFFKVSFLFIMKEHPFYEFPGRVYLFVEQTSFFQDGRLIFFTQISQEGLLNNVM